MTFFLTSFLPNKSILRPVILLFAQMSARGFSVFGCNFGKSQNQLILLRVPRNDSKEGREKRQPSLRNVGINQLSMILTPSPMTLSTSCRSHAHFTRTGKGTYREAHRKGNVQRSAQERERTEKRRVRGVPVQRSTMIWDAATISVAGLPCQQLPATWSASSVGFSCCSD